MTATPLAPGAARHPFQALTGTRRRAHVPLLPAAVPWDCSTGPAAKVVGPTPLIFFTTARKSFSQLSPRFRGLGREKAMTCCLSPLLFLSRKGRPHGG